MISRVVARAFANIALCKYWGKKTSEGNLPATPSISMTLQALKTETEIRHLSEGPDQYLINGMPVDQETARRFGKYLEYWRRRKLLDGHFFISSTNAFPTASGLASSSSGFAALAMGLSAFSKRKLNRSELSRLARRGSGSAARSIPGGLVKLPMGSNPAASQIISPAELPWGMAIIMVASEKKEISSRNGMRLSRSSPFYRAWLTQARWDYRKMLTAIEKRDFEAVGKICESNALAMHACMISASPPLLYWDSVTIELLKAVQKWRLKGLEAYATIDAGPNVAFLCKHEDLEKICRLAVEIPGVKQVLASISAPGAEIIESI